MDAARGPIDTLIQTDAKVQSAELFQWQGVQYVFGAWMIYFAILTFVNPHCAARRGWRWLSTNEELASPTLIDEDAESMALVRRPAVLDR